MAGKTNFAQKEYAAKAAMLREKMQQFEEQLVEHATAAANSSSWGYAGDLGRINSLMDEVLSACKVAGQ